MFARLAVSRHRPFNAGTVVRLVVTAVVGAAFLYGDFKLFQRLFNAVSAVEQQSPFFALGLLRNLIALVFLIAITILFSSSMTTSIGAFFADFDLDTYHAAPMSKTRLVLARWLKTLLQSATIVYIFIVPMFVAFARHYHSPASFYPVVLLNLAVLLAIPVTLGALVILALVRFFPVTHVHQVVATIAMLVLTVFVLALRLSRPERLFTEVTTDELRAVLRAVELPSIERYPGTALADYMTGNGAHGLWRVGGTFAVLFIAFVLIARRIYFAAYVRARESMAPAALGSGPLTRIVDRLLAPFSPATRALAGKEVRTLTRDVAQWSQLFLMAALMFLYLYNIRMLPLGGDSRATIVAYANLGMAGFVVAAICLRFAYPSVSSEGKAFWILQSAPVSYRKLLLVKVFVYGTPLTILSLVLTAFADVLLHADRVVWIFTLTGAAMLGITLVALGVGLGALAPNFAAENPLQVGLSLGGFGYMALALAYVGAIMLLMARPVMQYLSWRIFGVAPDAAVSTIPVVTAVTLSAALCVFPLLLAEKRLRIGTTRNSEP